MSDRRMADEDAGPTDDTYRHLAREAYHRDGAVEIDDNAVVSRGDESGAYVAAWVWVENPPVPDEEPPSPAMAESIAACAARVLRRMETL